MRRFIKQLLIICLILSLLLGVSTPALATTPANVPIVVYGDTLSTDQQEEVRRLLEVDESKEVKEFYVTGEDIATYIDGDPNSNMYSSAKIVREEEGKGLTINIVTAENITEVTTDMYKNALLTAGVEDATVDVASPIPVTGGSALSGIYKAYDEEGEMLDKDRMELASEELDVATDLAEREGMDSDKVTELLTDIKKEIAEQNPATKEDVEQIVKEQLDKLDISLSEDDREMLTRLFEKMQDLDIDFNQVKNQLEDIAATLKEKMDDIDVDPDFMEKVQNFFKKLFAKVSDIVARLLD